MAKPITVKHRKLGKEKAIGLAYKEDREIHIDSRLKGKDFLMVLIHEIMHIQNPQWTEKEVELKSQEMTDVIWDEIIKKLL